MSTPTNIPKTPMGETMHNSFFESKEKFHQQLQDIFQTIMRLTGPDQFDQQSQWMEYKLYLTIDDFYDSSYNDPEKFDTKGPATEYKWKGKMNHLSPNVAQKLKQFLRWMTNEERPYELHDDFRATLTRESYLKCRHMDTQSFSASSPSHHEPQQLKTSFSGESKHSTQSESQTALNNFKKGTKRDASVYPIFKNDKYYDTFQRSFLANLKAQGLYDVADPDHDPESGDTFETYYNLLWDAAHQYDLHQAKKGHQRKAFFSQQEEINDDDDYANAEEEFSTDSEPEEHSPYLVYQSSFHPKMPQKSFLPPKIRETLSESTKQMIIEHNKKVKLKNPTPYSSGSKTKPNPTLGKPTPAPQQVHQHSQDEPTEAPPPDTSTQTLVNKCLAESGIDPTDIQNVMSVSHAKKNISSHDSSRHIQTHQRYVFARVNQSNHHLIDRGANGGLAGADMRVIHTTPRKINIVAIDDHELTGLNVVTAAALLDTQKGPIIGVFHEYAHLGKGWSIHAAGQMEWFNCQVDDRSKIVGGAQRIETSEGYVIPLFIESGLVYMHTIRIPTDQDLQTYPHVFFTSPDIWDASVLDHEITPSLLEDINQHSDDSLLQDSIFDEYGDLHHRAIQTLNIFCDLPSLPPRESITHAHLHDRNSAEEDWKTLRPYFGWQSEQVIKDTYKVTSRFGGTIPQHDNLKKHFKSRNPVFNIPRQNEPVATDTIFSDKPAINDGSTMAQFFVGRDTLVCDAYGIKSQKQFINTLYDNIRFRGAMTTLITDGGRYEISK